MVNKMICPECKRKLNSRCFIYNPLKQIKLCHQCNRRIGNNKFYSPEIKGVKKRFSNYNNYNMKEDEKTALFKELISQGMDEEKARKRVNNRCKYIHWFQWRKTNLNKDEGNKNIMKNLLQGLHQ